MSKPFPDITWPVFEVCNANKTKAFEDMFERYCRPVYESIDNDEPLELKAFQGLDVGTREALHGHIRVNTLTKSKPFVLGKRVCIPIIPFVMTMTGVDYEIVEGLCA